MPSVSFNLPESTRSPPPPRQGIFRPLPRRPDSPTPGLHPPGRPPLPVFSYALLVTNPKKPEDNLHSIFQMLYYVSPLRRYFMDNGAIGTWHQQLSTMFKYMASEECKTFSDSKTILLVAGDAQSEQNIKLLFDDGKDGLPVPRDDAQMCLSNLLFELMEEAFTVRPPPNVSMLERENGFQVWDKYDYHEPKAFLDHMFAVQLSVRRFGLTCGHGERTVYDQYHLKVEPDSAPRADKVYPLSYYLKELMQGQTYQTFDPCETCGLEQTVNQDMSVTRFPPYLLVYLNSFKPGVNKQNRWVDIDERVEQCGQIYVLVSVVIHKGSVEKGIFWTVVRERKDYWVVLTDQWIVKGLDNVRAKELLKRFALVAMYKRVGVNSQATDQQDYAADDGYESISQESEIDLSKLLPGLTRKKSKSSQVPPQNVPQHVDKHPYCGLSNTPDKTNSYSNSILQVLYTCTHFREYLLKKPSAGPFHKLLAELFAQMQDQSRSNNKTSTVDPELKFNPQFRNRCTQFTSGQMHDAYAYMLALIHLIHEEVNMVKQRLSGPYVMQSAKDVWIHHVTYLNNSFISKLFLSLAESKATCKRCGEVHRKWCTQWEVKIDLGVQNRKVKLIDLLSQWDFTSEDTSNCTSCNGFFHKQLTYYKLPAYLVIHLMRFNENGTKNESQVSIVVRLKVQTIPYLLSSVVCHYPDQAGNTGHYVTVVRDAPNQWVLLENAMITRIVDYQTALEIINKFAYVCIYEAVLKKA